MTVEGANAPAGDVRSVTPGPVARCLRIAIRGYQYMFSWRPSPCRFDPTCSSYALQAIEAHGALRGSWLAVRRIGRCHPWGSHGWDPVPPQGLASPRVSPRPAGRQSS